MYLEVICTNVGMKYDYEPIRIDTLKYWKNRCVNQPVTVANLKEFEGMEGRMFAYPDRPDFGISKLGQFETPLYTNGQCVVKSIRLVMEPGDNNRLMTVPEIVDELVANKDYEQNVKEMLVNWIEAHPDAKQSWINWFAGI